MATARYFLSGFAPGGLVVRRHPVEVGRIEYVGTRPDYRRRGLVRRQMEVAHRWCAERGFPVQAISGIPNYYRRFGYEMALELWGGRPGTSRTCPLSPTAPQSRLRVRPVVAEDIPFLVPLDGQTRERWLVTAVRDEDAVAVHAGRGPRREVPA